MDITIRRLFLVFFFSAFCAFGIIAQNGGSTYQIKGRILDNSTKMPIPFANIYMPDIEKGTITDADGFFSFSATYRDNLRIRFSSLGYATQNITIKKNPSQIEILLMPLSIELEEFSVTAKYSENMGSDAKIGQEALEYIQPTSIKDIFLLLPGGTIGSNNIQNRSLTSSRQAGSDQSTSFGMGVSVDGMPMQNDGIRMQMGGYTGQSSTDPYGKVSSLNTGVDLRTISTDHIESVTVTKGIASAKEGNLSSGSIKVSSKKGKTPLRIRAKIDPLNKLAYVGKGFFLSEKLGTLHTGIDITKSASDLRSTKDAYNRITAQANYNNLFYLFGKKIDFNLRGSLVSSFSNTKKDELTEENTEHYKTTYKRYTASSKIIASLDYPIIDELEVLISADYSKDILNHDKKVSLTTVTISSTATQEGINEAIYLPDLYRTSYKIENKPLNIFSSISGTKQGLIVENLNYSVLAGTSLSHVKNHGRGVVVDLFRPPFPSDAYTRPRANSDIPALVNSASYIETKLRYQKGKNELNTSIGLRGTQVLNLPKDYALNGLLLLEPRIQFSYTLRNKIKEERMLSNTIRFGFGIENKLPSLDFLYPDKVYKDFVALNYYSNTSELRTAYVYSTVHDPSNSGIRENQNKKIELGWDIKYDKYIFSLTLFREKMKGGIEYYPGYTAISYTKYDGEKPKNPPITEKPNIDDFESKQISDYIISSNLVNSAKIIKKGLEYRISIPKIDIIKSDIEINGAYYKTLYTSGVPGMERPRGIDANGFYPYIGIYDGYEKTYSDRFNTNVWINTHLPKLKLIFTNFIQLVWFESSQLGRDVDPYPSKYMDLNGNIINITPQEVDNDSQLRAMKRVFNDARYEKNKRPVSMLINLKLTKEFNRSVKLSFFANNILEISPTYKTNFQRTERDWHSPFFGTELIINL
ncbi:TonB-dependent receptor [Dysgonomonas sp. BGC7]|uniref:TonB-dependent receptor n=1 Tax=Dysgonomonas sp. BGC7 TaxID=1658008 RepID=UPI000A7030F7|nr:TonB-dependent receptor [Dysgonomonas sp. BGC7]MBD8389326.1 carboxypeptidase-like regulatory domain-containing protein [Dysgonomonas sp. BGC7]